MKIIDDFVPTKYQDELESIFLGDNFNWFLNKTTVMYTHPGLKETADTREGSQFTHVFCVRNEVQSNFYGVVQPLLFNLILREGLCVNDILKVKANLLMKDANANPKTYRTPHVDYAGDTPCTTMIYYVNDADGDTLFFDGEGRIIDKVTPKKGRLVIFDSKITHAGQPPRVSETRVLLNFNIFNTGYTE